MDKLEIRYRFARRFKEYREELRLNQQELADRTGLSQQGIAQYETGQRLADFFALFKMRKNSGFSVDALIDSIAEEPAQ